MVVWICSDLYHKVMSVSANLSLGTRIVQLLQMPNGGSDKRLKKEIQEIDNVLDQVLALRPVAWHWQTDANDDRLKFGFIAQDVEKIFPHLVEEKEWKDGSIRKHLSPHDLIPYLTQALKEQQEQISELQKQLKDLRNQ